MRRWGRAGRRGQREFEKAGLTVSLRLGFESRDAVNAAARNAPGQAEGIVDVAMRTGGARGAGGWAACRDRVFVLEVWVGCVCQILGKTWHFCVGIWACL